ncbi:MAG: ABC transporter substrate-binding protein, partial [Isosphaeraceae bacterium]
MRLKRGVAAAVVVAAALVAAGAAMYTTAGAQPRAAKLTKVTLQLKWVTQAQFAGYYA